MIDTITRLGDDALANQFEIVFGTIPFIPTPDPLRFRIISVDIPEQSVSTYEVPWKTRTFTKPGGKIETPNDFSFSFRIDKYWTIYQGLKIWLNYVGDNDSGTMAEDFGAISGNSNIRTDISILTIDSNNVPTSLGWKFHGCFPSSLDGVSFDMGSGDPIEASVTMQFLKMTSFI